MKNLKDKIEKSVKNISRIGGFNGETSVYEIYDSDKDFSGKTSLRTKEIQLGFNPSIINKYGKEDKIIQTMNDIEKHEINHHGYKGCLGCPQTPEKDYELFFIPAYDFLSKKGFNKQDVNYATNALEDTELHLDLNKNNKSSLRGIVNFFENIGEKCEGKKFSEFYEAHVKLNMFLWGNRQQKKRMQRFYTHSKKVNGGMKNFLDRTGHLRDSRNKKINFLDESNWKEITRIYVEEFSELMTPGYALPLINHSGAGTNGRESEDGSNEGNVFQKQKETRSFKKGEVLKADKNNDGTPEWINKFEVLDIYYENKAEELVIKAESYTNPESMPMIWFGKRPFDLGKDNLRHVGFGFGDRGNIELKKKQYSIDIPIRIKTSPKSFPEVKIGGSDISISMLEDILGGDNIGKKNIVPWGDNSKYHWSCLVDYGLFEYFRRNNLMIQNTISSFFFGRETKIVSGLRNIKEKILNPQFENYTQLNWKEIKPFFEGRGNLIYTKSDGIIGNWSSIKDDFIGSILERGHSYVHLHMGTVNDMTRDLQKNGLEVIFAEDGKGIVQRVINLTDKIFRGEK